VSAVPQFMAWCLARVMQGIVRDQVNGERQVANDEYADRVPVETLQPLHPEKDEDDLDPADDTSKGMMRSVLLTTEWTPRRLCSGRTSQG